MKKITTKQIAEQIVVQGLFELTVSEDVYNNLSPQQKRRVSIWLQKVKRNVQKSIGEKGEV